MKNKLKLNDLKLQSFVTSIEKKEVLKGGIADPTKGYDTMGIEQHCSNFTCGIVRCTFTVDLECTTERVTG
jgi:hypothetical protein